MRIAIPIWSSRVSPVFDVARRICVFDVDIESALVVASRTIEIDNPTSCIAALGVDLLICSAISRIQEATLRRSGTTVISGVCGPVEEIALAYVGGDTALLRFRAPGDVRRDCKHGRGRRARRRVVAPCRAFPRKR